MSRPSKVMVTGIGVVSPIGDNCGAFWSSLMSGQCGVAPIRSFDAAPFPVHIGCQVPARVWLAASDHSPPPGRTTRLAATAGLQAIRQAGIDGDDLASTALCVGTTMGESCWIEGWPEDLVRNDTFPAEELMRSGPDEVGRRTAALLGLGGRVTTVAGACAAGNYAIGLGLDLIRSGRAERVLAGGADAFSRVAFTGFGCLGALTATACRPFSADRDGIVLGEGAGMLVLESLESARRRSALPLAEVAGYGLSSDAHHIVRPKPDGDGMVRAMRAALQDAGRSPDDVDYVCAHGTGTPANDRAEAAAVSALFGADLAKAPPMSSIKALTGHGLGAASALEAIACVLALQHETIPPTWNFRELDPNAAWDVVPNAPRPQSLHVVLNNAAAFGGNNSAVVFVRPSE